MLSKQKVACRTCRTLSDTVSLSESYDLRVYTIGRNIDNLYVQVSIRKMSDMSDKCPTSTSKQWTKITTTPESQTLSKQNIMSDICPTCPTSKFSPPAHIEHLYIDSVTENPRSQDSERETVSENVRHVRHATKQTKPTAGNNNPGRPHHDHTR